MIGYDYEMQSGETASRVSGTIGAIGGVFVMNLAPLIEPHAWGVPWLVGLLLSLNGLSALCSPAAD